MASNHGMHMKDSGGTWRALTEVHMKDTGGTWREAREVYQLGPLGWKLAHTRYTVALSGEDITLSGYFASNGFRFNSDGTIDKAVDGVYTQIDSGTDWIIPNADGAYLNQFEIRRVLNSGSISTDMGSGWLDLATSRFIDTASGMNLTIEIRHKVSLNVLASGTYIA